MPTYYWYDEALLPGAWPVASSKASKGTSWGSSTTKAGKSEEAVHYPYWWGGYYGGKARKMTETAEVIVENGEGKPGRALRRNKKNEDVVVDESNEDDALFYTLNTAMPSGYHTVSFLDHNFLLI